MFFETLSQIIANFEDNQHSFEYRSDDKNLSYFVHYSNIDIGNKIIPCDTTIIEIDGFSEGDPLINFSTFIIQGMEGDQIEYFDEVISGLNYEYAGKFARDYTDGSQDVLYMTLVRLSEINENLLRAHLDHHASVKAQVTPELEHLADQLGLNPRIQQNPINKFVFSWLNTFKQSRKLLREREIKPYPLLPRGE